MLFFALGRALLNRVSRQTRLRKNPFILLTLEVSSEHIWTWIRGHFAYRTLKQIAKNLPLINLRPMQYQERTHHWPVFGHHGFHVLVHFVFWQRDLEQTFKATVKRATTTWYFFFFATLPQNVLKSDVPLFNTPVQACLKTSKGCCMLREYRLFIG